jgi:hypothetical protein
LICATVVLASVLAPTSFALAASDTLTAGQTLGSGSSLASATGGYVLVMQTDGNLVLYGPGSVARFASHTEGRAGAFLTLQHDGNLVVYSAAGKPLWFDNVFPGDGARLIAQSDGNLVEYSSAGRPAWDSQTAVTPPPSGNTLQAGQTLAAGQGLRSSSQQYALMMQGDGNLVEYGTADQRVVWSALTYGHPGAILAMQSDGNAVVYQGGRALWNSGSSGHPGTRLVVQDDGNVVTYAGSQATWASGGDWLAEMNKYRSASGLGSVKNNAAWESGLQHHLYYLSHTPSTYMTGQYQSLHTENPASPYYTADGAQEGGRSNLFMGGGATPLGYVDAWLASPFHAIGMLRPGLSQVAFASNYGYTALDVLGGYQYQARSTPVLFPGPGMTTNLRTYSGSESPNPLESCGWTGGPGFPAYGLPLIAMLPSAPAAGIVASVSGPGGVVQSTSNGQLCVVDEHTYRSSDTVYGPTGASILQGSDHPVVLIARNPYRTGTYAVSINQPAVAPITWSFAVS